MAIHSGKFNIDLPGKWDQKNSIVLTSDTSDAGGGRPTISVTTEDRSGRDMKTAIKDALAALKEMGLQNLKIKGDGPCEVQGAVAGHQIEFSHTLEMPNEETNETTTFHLRCAHLLIISKDIFFSVNLTMSAGEEAQGTWDEIQDMLKTISLSP